MRWLSTVGVAAVVVFLGASCSRRPPPPSRNSVASSAPAIAGPTESAPAARPSSSPLDRRVRRFLDDNRESWRDFNVPYEDGRVLHDLVVRGKFRSILEVGTSTGHSTVWLAWAASKTGGKVQTIEIDKRRYDIALANVEKAGLSSYVEAFHADAHELVKTLPGPFDFVFSDADKAWYIQYFEDVHPRISPGGCIAAHNALNGFSGVDRYIAHVKRHPAYVTRIERSSPSGFAISCKKPASN